MLPLSRRDLIRRAAAAGGLATAAV
ncbi:twin-arginine translocation signal domain-containing protein, partial [Nocardioides sp.]